MKIKYSFCFGSCFLALLACKGRIPKEWQAPPAEYPGHLGFNPSDGRYIGTPELEIRALRNGFMPSEEVAPIETFDLAYRYACKVISENASVELLNDILPLLIDFEDGIWIVSGSLQPDDDPDRVVTLSGNVEIAFVGETGEVLYMYFSL